LELVLFWPVEGAHTSGDSHGFSFSPSSPLL